MNLLWAIGASLLVSIVSLIGVFSLYIDDRFLNRLLNPLLGFAAGALIGGAFLHLIPRALEHMSPDAMSLLVIGGFILFFMLEKYLHWRHCHLGVCEVHPFTYLNLIGDGIHNFFDGLIIGGGFFLDFHLGVTVTIAVILHEIPQEIGDFAVLVCGGFSKGKALFFNFLSALTSVAGAVIGYLFSHYTVHFLEILLPFAAGGFIYIASCDLIPELHKQTDTRRSVLSLFFFLTGIGFMFLSKTAHGQ